jgi:hypothetical protein
LSISFVGFMLVGMAGTDAPAPIDPRGPRTNQAVLATALVLGLVFQQEWVAPLFAVVLFLGAAFGPDWGPVLRVYRDVIKPRLSPPDELEDPRPPRFAASVGVVFLGAATTSFLLGAPVVGWVLVGIVALLAGVSAITGLCVGCEMYVWLVRLRGGVRVVKIDRTLHEGTAADDVVEGESVGTGHARAPRHAAPLPAELRDAGWLVFSTEYCAVCPAVVAEIESRRPGERVVVVDVADNLDLASAYKVRRAPTVLRTDGEGNVVAKLSGVDAVRAELARVPAGV